MPVLLGPNQYGKAENRLVRVYRDTPRHQIRDLNVSTSLRGDFTEAHIVGDQAAVLTTDAQKNTVFGLAKELGVSALEEFGLALANHFLTASDAANGARIELEEYAWDRIETGENGHDHAFVRRDLGTRIASVDISEQPDGRASTVIAGIKDLMVLKSTGSEFNGFLRERFTTLADSHDRILATSLQARWRYRGTDVNWDAAFDVARNIILKTFASVHSLAMQQSLFRMGEAVIEGVDAIDEIRFSAPNKHHLTVDLLPFGLDNASEVFLAADRPYGLIEATVLRDGATALLT
jgi:urate oxidase